MQALTIIVGCVAAAVGCGVLHDLVTAHVCVEYFTVGHPPVFRTDDPVLLALGWGVIATWWVGLLLGVPLAIAARAGSWPPRAVRSLVRPVAALLAVAAVLALVAGMLGWTLAEYGVVRLIGRIADEVPADRHARFIADLWAHSTSYLAAFVGGVVVVMRTWRSRKPPRGMDGEPSRGMP